MALNLIDNANYFFLSRPRHFGKSLFLDMLKELFEGKKELFRGLYTYDKWNWDSQGLKENEYSKAIVSHDLRIDLFFV